MKHRWSPVAGAFGFFITVVLAIPSDITPNMFLAVVCPAVVILGKGLELLHLSEFSTWEIALLVAVAAAGDAIWYMLLVEAARMLIARIRGR
jgi:hypothetical protein